MSSDQVRWRINYLTKKYKECVDNNLKSGRSPMSFEYFNEMENILGCKKAVIATYSISSNLPSKISNNSSTKLKIQSHNHIKKQKKDLNYTLVNTSPNILVSISPTSGSNLVSISANTSKNINYQNKENECTRIKSSYEKKSTCTSSQLKNKFENYWLEYMQKEEKRREDRYENILKTKKEALKLKKYYIEMREKELEVKNSCNK